MAGIGMGFGCIRHRLIVVVIRVAFFVMVSLGAVQDLLLQLDRRDAGSVFEHHLSAELSGTDQDR